MLSLNLLWQEDEAKLTSTYTVSCKDTMISKRILHGTTQKLQTHHQQHKSHNMIITRTITIILAANFCPSTISSSNSTRTVPPTHATPQGFRFGWRRRLKRNIWGRRRCTKMLLVKFVCVVD